MKVLLLFIPLIGLLAGCTSYGYHPHYIISQDEIPENTQEEIR